MSSGSSWSPPRCLARNRHTSRHSPAPLPLCAAHPATRPTFASPKGERVSRLSNCHKVLAPHPPLIAPQPQWQIILVHVVVVGLTWHMAHPTLLVDCGYPWGITIIIIPKAILTFLNQPKEETGGRASARHFNVTFSPSERVTTRLGSSLARWTETVGGSVRGGQFPEIKRVNRVFK